VLDVMKNLFQAEEDDEKNVETGNKGE